MNPVYQEHFGLIREPFNITPNPDFLYLSTSHREGLAQLLYGIKGRKGFVVLTGEVGTGKTTLIHALLEVLNGNTHTALMFNTMINPKDLLRSVCQDFGLTAVDEGRGKRDLHDYVTLLNQFLLESYRKGDNVALIIDEAQNLSTEVLEIVRLLSNFETPRDKLLQILMIGQPELATRLNSPELRQLKQRVLLRHQLRPLSFSDCKEYVARRIEIAGGTPSIFSLKALETLYTYSGGIPRLINILCDNGLLTAFGLGKKCVDASIIQEVAKDLDLVAPIAPPKPEDLPAKNPAVNPRRTVRPSRPATQRGRRWGNRVVPLIALSSFILAIGILAGQWTDFSFIKLDFLSDVIEKILGMSSEIIEKLYKLSSEIIEKLYRLIEL